MLNGTDGFKFVIKDEEVLRISEDGKFYVKGKLITQDEEVYHAFREFLNLTKKAVAAQSLDPDSHVEAGFNGA